MEQKQEDENLPIVAIKALPVASQEVTLDSTIEEIQKQDLVVANAMLSAVHDCWKHVKSLNALTRMVDTTIKATAHRRAVIGKPYGAKSEVTKGTLQTFVPD